MQNVQRAVEQVADLRESYRYNGWALAVESPTQATLYIRRGRQVAYAGRIGFSATAVELTREKAKASPWIAVPESEETVLWPLGLDENDTDNIPHPAEVMTWLGWHEVRVLRKIVERCYGVAATTSSAWTLRAYIGSAYQVAWMDAVRRTPGAAYRARLRALTRLLTVDATDEDAREACERAVNVLTSGGTDVDEQPNVEEASVPIETKQPIVKKKTIVKEPAADAKPNGGGKAKAGTVRKPKAKPATKVPKEKVSRGITDPKDLKAKPGANPRVKDYIEAAKTLKVGDRRKYDGRNEMLTGKTGTVVGFAPDGSVFCDYPDVGRYMSTPFALGVPDPAKASRAEKSEKKSAAKKVAGKKKAA